MEKPLVIEKLIGHPDRKSLSSRNLIPRRIPRGKNLIRYSFALLQFEILFVK